MAPQSRRIGKSKAPTQQRRSSFFRPRCEQLETRVVPALFNVQTPLAPSGLNNNGFVGVADLNNDGLDDCVFTNFGSDYGSGAGSTITVLYGRASGGFQSPRTLATGGTNVSFVDIDDIDGDGWLDVVATNANGQNAGSVSVFKNDGTGFLSLFGTPFLTQSNNPSWVGLHDITKDGILDVVVCSFGKGVGGETVVGNNVTIFQGNGDFTFSLITTLAPEIQFIPIALAVADYDGDDNLDIAAVVPGVPPSDDVPQPEGWVYVFKGNGSGGFNPPTLFGTGGALPVNIQAGDIDNDGKPDLIVANTGDPKSSPEFLNNSVGVLRNLSTGGGLNFDFANSLVTNCYGTFAVAVADLDLDGDTDIASINFGTQDFFSSPEAFVSVYLGNGSGAFSAGSPGKYNTGTGFPGGQYLAVGDFDHNGSPDLVVSHATNLVGLLLNTTASGPSVTINQAAGQADPTNGASISYDVVFSEGVSGFSNTDVDLSASTGGGAGLSVNVSQNTTSSYTITVTGMTGTGTVRASIPPGAATAISDGAASGASTSSDNQVAYDLVAPTVTINQAAGQADPATIGPIQFTVIFTENVTGFTNADVDLSSSTLAGLSCSVVQNTPSNYTVNVNGMAGNGTVVATVIASAANDSAGNPSAASTSSDNSVTFGLAPSVTINQGSGQADPTNGISIVFDVIFSEGVNGFDNTDISFSGSSVGGLSANVAPIDSSHFTVTVTGMVGTGLVRVSIPAAAATSIASGTASTASTSSDNQVNFDLLAPTVTIDQAVGQLDPATSGPILFTVIFTENVTGFTNADVDLSLSSLSGLSCNVVQNTASNYTVSVTGMVGNGTVVARVIVAAAIDGVGNPSAASTSTDNTVTFGTVPSVTINQGSGQADPTNSTSIVFDVIFSEGVNGFTNSDIDFTGSSVGGLSANVTPIDSSHFTVSVTGMIGTGLVKVAIPAAAATSIATGTASTASTSSDNQVNFDLIAPTVTIDQAVGQVDPAKIGPILFTVIFMENVTGFTNLDVDLSSSSLGGLTANVIQNTPSNYTVSVTGMTGVGTVVARVMAGAAIDGVGNASAASTSTDNSVAFDNVAPTVTINQAAGQADPTNIASIAFDVVFSEPVLGFSFVDVSLAGSTVGGSLSINVSGSLANYTVTVTGMTSAGLVIASIPAAGVTDNAGNANAASTSTDNSVTFQTGTVGMLGFSQAIYNTTEDPLIHTVTITVSRTGGTLGAVSIQYGTTDGTAHSGGPAATGQDDYAPTNGTLNWVNGEGGDKTFTIEIRPDNLNEGKELINIALSNATGGVGLGLTTATAAIAPSDGLGQGTYFDQDGDMYKIKFLGLTGAMQFFRTDPDGDGKGPIELIELSNTLPNPLLPKASLVIGVKRSLTSTDGGTVGLGAITGSGMKKITAKKANLNLEGIDLDGYLGALTIGNIVNGADITTLATNNLFQRTKINAQKILDGTVIDVAAPISSLKALSFGAGLLKAPSVGAISIKGTMSADVDISGVGVSTSANALTALKVKGAVTGSDIMVKGNVGSVTVGAFRDSRIFVGYIGADNGTGTFTATATLGSFRSTGVIDGFQNSRVIASYIRSVALLNVHSTNATTFGFYADMSVAALTAVAPAFTYDATLSAWQGVDQFEVVIV